MNSDVRKMFEENLGQDYDIFYHKRPQKSDAVATLVSHRFLAIDIQNHQLGPTDRVAMLLRIAPSEGIMTACLSEDPSHETAEERWPEADIPSFLLVNTHLSFDYGNLWAESIRKTQAKCLIDIVDSYHSDLQRYSSDYASTGIPTPDYTSRQQELSLFKECLSKRRVSTAIELPPTILAGDINGMDDPVTDYFFSKNYRSTRKHITSKSRAVTHLTHCNKEIEADQIWLSNWAEGSSAKEIEAEGVTMSLEVSTVVSPPASGPDVAQTTC